jgi:hypothetical protein
MTASLTCFRFANAVFPRSGCQKEKLHVLGSASFISLVVLGLIVFDQSVLIIRSKSRCQAVSQQRRERESAVLLFIVLVASLLLPSHSGPGRSTAGPRPDFHLLEGALPENLENEKEKENNHHMPRILSSFFGCIHI